MARSDDKVQQCLKHGATWAFNYRTEDWAGNVKLSAKPAGVHVILDCVGRAHSRNHLPYPMPDIPCLCQIILLQPSSPEVTTYSPSVCSLS